MNQSDNTQTLESGRPGAAQLLGVLLAAGAPLGLDALGAILGGAPADLMAALDELGEIVARDGQGGLYLAHRRFQEYPDLAPEDYATSHRRLAAWCAGGEAIWRDSADAAEQQRRIYARIFYVNHLVASQDWAELWRVMDDEDYGRHKMVFDRSARLYALDLDHACQAAIDAGASLDERIALLPRLWRYSLLRDSLSRQIDAYPEGIFELMARCGRLQEAVDSIDLLSWDYQAFNAWCALAGWAVENGQAAAAPFLERARLCSSAIEDAYRALYLADLAGGYRAAGQAEAADRLLDDALELARANQDQKRQSDQLARIALQLAESGRAAALDIARAFSAPAVRAALGCDLAARLERRGERQAAATALELALAAAPAITAVGKRDEAWGRLAAHMAETGDLPRARAAAAAIEDSRRRDTALLALAGPTARADEAQAALAILEQVLAGAAGIEDAGTRVALRLDIAAQLKAYGAPAAAEAVIDDALAFVAALDPEEAEEVAGQIAPALSRHGRLSEALALADSQPEDDDWEEVDRSDTLKDIAVILAQDGQLGAAEEVACRIEDAELQGTAMLEIATLARERGDHELTDALIDQALAAFQSMDYRERFVERMVELAKLALRHGAEERAGAMLDELIAVAHTINIHFHVYTPYAMWEIDASQTRARQRKQAQAKIGLMDPSPHSAPDQEALAAARQIAEPLERVKALVEIGRRLCANSQPGLAAALLPDITYPAFFHSLAQDVLAAGADDEALAIIVGFIQTLLRRRKRSSADFQTDLRLLLLLVPQRPSLGGELAASLAWAASMIEARSTAR